MIKRLIILLSLFSIWSIALEAKIIEGIAAKVNKEIITLSELEAAKRAFSGPIGIPVDQIPEEVTREILNRLIKSKLVLQEAKKRKIQIPSEEVERVLAETKRRFKDEEEFKKALASQGYTSIEDLKREYEEEMMGQKLIDQEVRSKIKIAPKELEEIGRRFSTQLHAKHILVETHEKAQTILQRLRQGDDFEKLAKECSLCPSKEKGGDLGFFTQGEMIEEFSKIAFALKDGEISDVVKTTFGYHIIKAIEHRPTPKQELERLKEEVRHLLWEKKFKEGLDKWLKELFQKAYIEVKL